MAGRHRKVSHARARGRARHRKPASRGALLAPVGLGAAVVVAGSIAFAQSGDGDGHGPGAAAGIVVTVPSPVSPPPVTALLTTHTKHKSPAHHEHHRSAHNKHHVTPDTLQIRDTGPPCYVEVTRRDGRVLVERVIHGHQRLAYRQHGLQVVLGNAGAVRISVNGHRTHRAGSAGQVLRFRVR